METNFEILPEFQNKCIIALKVIDSNRYLAVQDLKIYHGLSTGLTLRGHCDHWEKFILHKSGSNISLQNMAGGFLSPSEDDQWTFRSHLNSWEKLDILVKEEGSLTKSIAISTRNLDGEYSLRKRYLAPPREGTDGCIQQENEYYWGIVLANALKDLPRVLKENEFEFNETHLLFPQQTNFRESMMKPLYEILKMTKTYKPLARIVLMGKTGQGKSTLGNKIVGVEKFKVGEGMIAETSEISELEFAWPEDKEIQVLLVDTPGLADNRKIKELSNEQIMKNIKEYMGNLDKGLNVGLFCWAAQQRFSADDLNELALIQELLGKGVIEHLWICITQLDTRIESEAQKIKANALRDLPKILQENGFEFNETHLLFPQKTNFRESIMKPLHEILKVTKPYKPPVVENPAAVYLQFMMEELEKEAKAMTKKLEEVNNQTQKNIIVRQLSETQKDINRYKSMFFW